MDQNQQNQEIPIMKADGSVNTAGILSGSSVKSTNKGLSSPLLQKAVEMQQRQLVQERNDMRNELHGFGSTILNNPNPMGLGKIVRQNNMTDPLSDSNRPLDNTTGEIIAKMF